MILFFVALLCSLLFLSPWHWILDLSQGFHAQCLDFIAPQTLAKIQQAFICGTPLKNPHHYQIFRSTGLLHLIVVSGSHLAFLQQRMDPLLTKKWTWRPLIMMGTLCIYTSCCLWEPPVTRAFFYFVITWVAQTLRWNASTYRRIFYSGLACLLLFPPWIHSQSLMLSWLASLAISASRNIIYQCALCYFVLCPILIQYSTVHPSTIFVNVLIAPFFGTLLLPMTIIGNTITLLLPALELIWEGTLYFLDHLSQWMPTIEKKSGATRSAPFLLWAYILSVHGGLWILNRFQFLRKLH